MTFFVWLFVTVAGSALVLAALDTARSRRPGLWRLGAVVLLGVVLGGCTPSVMCNGYRTAGFVHPAQCVPGGR